LIAMTCQRACARFARAAAVQFECAALTPTVHLMLGTALTQLPAPGMFLRRCIDASVGPDTLPTKTIDAHHCGATAPSNWFILVRSQSWT
jgi:hypothetical protein